MDNTTYIYGKSIKGNTISVPVVFNKATVDDIKIYISEKFKIEKNNLKIILCGVELKDSTNICDTNILYCACFHFIENNFLEKSKDNNFLEKSKDNNFLEKS